MKISDFSRPIPAAVAQQWGLLFSRDFAVRLRALHSQYGSTNCVPVPAETTDGRFLLSADVLTETEPGGLLYKMWMAADQQIIDDNVAVIPWEAAVNLLPNQDSLR